MKIVNLVLNNFTNDNRVLRTSKSLAVFGFDVKIVALHDIGLPENECIDDVEVHRIALRTRKWPKNKLIQIIKLFEFILKFLKSYRKYDLLHCNDLDGLLVGSICKLTNRKIKIIYDSHEFAINDIPNQSKSSIYLKYLLENYLIKFALDVITVSDSIAKEYQRIYKISKPHVVLNCPNYKDVKRKNIFREVFPIRENQVIFLYQGGLGLGRGIEILMDTFLSFEQDRIVIIFMGSGSLEYKILEKAEQSKTIFFHPAVSPEILLNYTSSADYGVLFYEDNCLNHRYCSPNKIFEYLMAGLPVLTSNLFEMKRLVETDGIGIVAESNTVEGLKKAVQLSLFQNYANLKNKVFIAQKKYCWETQEIILKKIYSNL
jgi:glycosyltransferase involved in cell wall biosynthesis